MFYFLLQINNAGISSLHKDTTFENVKPVLDTNYFGVKNGTKALLPLFHDDTPGGARVVVVASTLGQLKVTWLDSPTLQQLINGHLFCTSMESLALLHKDRYASRTKFSVFWEAISRWKLRNTVNGYGCEKLLLIESKIHAILSEPISKRSHIHESHGVTR
jgi:hypothetical protein